MVKLKENLEEIAIESAVDYDLNFYINHFKKGQISGGSKYTKCSGDLCGSRSRKSVPFTLVQMISIYDTFHHKYPVSKQDFLKKNSISKRNFFCDYMASDSTYCKRLIDFVKGDYKLPDKIKKSLKKDELKKLYKGAGLTGDFEYKDDETFGEFKKRVNFHFSTYKYDKINIENLCNSKGSTDRIVFYKMFHSYHLFLLFGS